MNNVQPTDERVAEQPLPRRAWTLQELATIYGLSVEWFRLEMRAGRLPTHNAGRRVLVFDDELQEYIGRYWPKREARPSEPEEKKRA